MAEDRLRVDKWLFFARITKSRAIAAALANGGRIRVNRVRIDQASKTVRAGDVLTIVHAGRVRVVRVIALGTRRGPAAEAQRLYEDLTLPAAAGTGHPVPPSPAGGGRPTKRERRRIDAWRGQDLRWGGEGKGQG